MLLPINAASIKKTIIPKSPLKNSNSNFKNSNNAYTTGICSLYQTRGLFFKGYDQIGENSFEKTVFDNYFELPKITDENGQQKQIMPDKNQLECAKKLYEGQNLLFATGTGNGKTAVAHYIMTKNLKEGKKSIYTVPIKALANDKYKEFSKIYGKNNVGLLTGETKINPDAPIVVSVTEIYDKQLNNVSSNPDVATTIYDEAHYISDRDRGCAWENSIINSVEKGIQTLFLSATIGNSDDFTSWISKLNPKTTTSALDSGFKDRNVPLVWYLYKSGDFKTITDGRKENDPIRKVHTPRGENNFFYLINKLQSKDMLPCIIFKQSQRGCDEISDSLLDLNLDLTSEDEKKEIEKIIKDYKKQYSFLSLNEEALKRGYGSHHAGKLPQEKRLVEELFSKKLLKAIIATTTLSAGINTPTRTTVICSMTHGEYNPSTGEIDSVPLSANEFHQMAGRAGRRGIDKLGHVVLYNLATPKTGFFDNTKTPPDNKKDSGNQKSTKRIDELDLAYKLIASNPDDLKSQYRAQPVILAQYFENNSTYNNLENIINKTFKIHLAQNSEKGADKTFESLMKKFQNLGIVLLKQGYITKDNKGEISLLPKGHILTLCQGANPLLLSSLLYDEKLKDLKPAELAQIAGYLACPDNNTDKPESKFLPSVLYSKIGNITNAKNSVKNFKTNEHNYTALENKITKSELESRVSLIDIKRKNSFAGYISYLWATLNEKYPYEKEGENFKKLISEALDAPKNLEIDLEKEFKRKATAGNTYMTIAQTISVLSQIDRICDFALERDDLFYNDEYWKNLKETTKKALELTKKEPFTSEELFKNP